MGKYILVYIIVIILFVSCSSPEVTQLPGEYANALYVVELNADMSGLMSTEVADIPFIWWVVSEGRTYTNIYTSTNMSITKKCLSDNIYLFGIMELARVD